MASMKLEEKEEQVYLTDKYVCVKLMIKLHSLGEGGEANNW
jgi:hypothetical protein